MPSLPILQMQSQPQENDVELLSLDIELPETDSTIALNSQYSIGKTVLFLFQITTLSARQRRLQFFIDRSDYLLLSQEAIGQRILNVTAADNSQSSMLVDPEQNLLLLGVDRLTEQRCFGSAPLFALAKQRQQQKSNPHLALSLLASEHAFGFRIKPARFMVHTNSPEAIGACSLLEDWQISNRLASKEGEIGAMEGTLSELLHSWLSQGLRNQQSWQVFLAGTNKKGQQQLLTFNYLRKETDFKAVFSLLESLQNT